MDETRLTRIERNQASLEAKVENLATELLGPPLTDIDGQIVRDGGLRRTIEEYGQTIESLTEQMKNGVKVKFPWQFWASVVGSVSAVVIAIVQVG